MSVLVLAVMAGAIGVTLVVVAVVLLTVVHAPRWAGLWLGVLAVSLLAAGLAGVFHEALAGPSDRVTVSADEAGGVEADPSQGGPNVTKAPSRVPNSPKVAGAVPSVARSADAATVPATGLPTASRRELAHLDPAVESSTRSTRSGAGTSVDIVNRSSGVIRVYWLDTDGKRVLYKTLAVGAGYEQQTYAGHAWLVTDVAGRVILVAVATEAPASLTVT